MSARKGLNVKQAAAFDKVLEKVGVDAGDFQGAMESGRFGEVSKLIKELSGIQRGGDVKALLQDQPDEFKQYAFVEMLIAKTKSRELKWQERSTVSKSTVGWVDETKSFGTVLSGAEIYVYYHKFSSVVAGQVNDAYYVVVSLDGKSSGHITAVLHNTQERRKLLFFRDEHYTRTDLVRELYHIAADSYRAEMSEAVRRATREALERVNPV